MQSISSENRCTGHGLMWKDADGIMTEYDHLARL